MPSRRTVLRALSVGAAGLAGCGGQAGTDSPSPTTSPTDSPTESPTDSPTATETETETDTPEDTPRDVTCETEWAAEPTWSLTKLASLTGATPTGNHLLLGTDDALQALDPASGKLRWRQPDAPGHVATVVDGHAVVNGFDRLAVADADGGDVAWTFDPPDEHGHLSGSVGVHDGVLYAGASAVPTPETQVENPYGRLYAFDLVTGERRFVRDLAPEGEHPVQPDDVVAGDAGVFLTVERGGLFGVDLDGTVRWRTGEDDWYYRPALAGDTVFQPTSRTLVAVDAATGETRWTDDGPEMGVAVADGVVYGAGGGGPDADGTLAALDAKTGRHRWEATVSGCGADPAVGDGVLAVPVDCRDRPQRVTLFDAETGCRYGHFQPEQDDVYHRTAVGDGRLYVVSGRGDTGTVRAFTLP